MKTDRLTLSQAYSCHRSSNTPSTSSHAILCPVSSLALQSRVMVRQTTRWSESARSTAEVYLGKTLNPQQVGRYCSAADCSLWSACGKRQAKKHPSRDQYIIALLSLISDQYTWSLNVCDSCGHVCIQEVNSFTFQTNHSYTESLFLSLGKYDMSKDLYKGNPCSSCDSTHVRTVLNPASNHNANDSISVYQRDWIWKQELKKGSKSGF